MAKKFNSEFRVGQGGILEVNADRDLPGDANLVLVDASAGPVTVTLLRADGHGGKRFCIKKVDSSVNVVTIVPIAGQTIDGQVSVELALLEQSIDLISDNENYLTIAQGSGPTISLVKSFLSAASSAVQAFAVDTVLNIDTVDAQRGTNIVLNPVTHQFTLKAGKTYKLFGSGGFMTVGATDVLWFDITNAVKIGSVQALDTGDGGNLIAVIIPIVDTIVEFRMGPAGTGSIGFTAAGREIFPFVFIEEI